MKEEKNNSQSFRAFKYKLNDLWALLLLEKTRARWDPAEKHSKLRLNELWFSIIPLDTSSIDDLFMSSIVIINPDS